VSSVRPSPDGKLIAGLSHDWQVGIRETGGVLRHVLDMPRAGFADNAALALSPDGKRLAFCAGTEAGMWDVQSGYRLERWVGLPTGLTDQIAFHPNGGAYLFRTELDGGPNASWQRDSRLCRLRELLPGGGLRVVQTITDFPRHVEIAEASPDGRHFAALGVDRDGKSAVRVYDSATGREVWWSAAPARGQYFAFDPTGGAIFTGTGGKPATMMTELPSGKDRGTRDQVSRTWGPGGLLAAEFVPNNPANIGIVLFRAATTDPAVMLPLRVQPTSTRMYFSADGQHLVWGNDDGSVMVADVPVVKGRLDELKLGW
jgi:WD40 repeat protein